MKIEFKEKLNVLEEYVINVFPLILSSKLIPHSPINFSSTFDTSLIFDRASHFSIHPCSFLAPLSINFNTYTAAHSKQINARRRQRFFFTLHIDGLCRWRQIYLLNCPIMAWKSAEERIPTGDAWIELLSMRIMYYNLCGAKLKSFIMSVTRECDGVL